MVKRKSTRRRHLVKALRSGKYAQAKGTLEYIDADGRPRGNCCLGVACRVAMKDGLNIEARIRPVRGDTWFADPCVADRYGWMSGSSTCLFPAVMEWYGFTDAGGAYGDERSLMNDNDDRGHTFEQIADTIEAEPVGLFVES